MTENFTPRKNVGRRPAKKVHTMMRCGAWQWRREEVKLASIIWSVGVLGFVLVIGVVVGVIQALPAPLPLDASKQQFSEARALQYWQYLTQVIGPRPAYTRENRDQTVKYLSQQLQNIRDSMNKTEVGRFSWEVRRLPGRGRHGFNSSKDCRILGLTNIQILFGNRWTTLWQSWTHTKTRLQSISCSRHISTLV
jgi:hypothetical protein